VLAVHGLNDYSLAFDNAGRHLSAAGIAVFAYDQRGFGASEGWAYWHGAQRMSRDLIEAADRLRRRYPEPPFYILGESMGGAVVLASLAHRLPENDGIVLVAPAVWPRAAMPFWQRWGLSLLSHTLPGKRLTGEGLELRPTDNIDMLRAWARDPLVIKATRVDVLHGVTNLMDQADAAADRLAGRVLLLYGAHDDIVPRPAVCRFLKTLPDKAATGLTVAVYPDGHHMLMRDLHADRVLDDIVAWMENPVDFSPPEGDSFCDRPGR
jgi:alpha-beta hydrolase superfamily lysophospholipase